MPPFDDMFLHSGASLHGHEYSKRQLGQPSPRRSPLRSAFASSPSHSNTSSTVAAPSVTSSPASTFRPSPLSKGSHPASTLQTGRRQRPVSDGSSYRQQFPEPAVRFQEPVVRFQDPVDADVPARRLSLPAKFNPRPREPMSDDETTYSASETSCASDQASVLAGTSKRLRRRRAPRKSTAFIFAHPAPKLATKKHLLQHIRPTLLLQLQQVSDRRPLPVIDVYPASLIAGNVVAPRFSKLPRLFGVNGELGIHDTILVRNGDYDAQSRGSESDADDDTFDRRPLLAVLSPLRREDRSEIVLEDGTVWTAIPLSSGSFDFICVDTNGRATTARWVRRPAKADTGTDAPHAELECKLTFSVINPDSRRHPILATLTKSSLDVLDHYTTVSASSGRYPPTRSRTISPPPIETDLSNDEEVTGAQEAPDRYGPATQSTMEGRTTHPVDGAMRDFICITAIWVALQLGWAQGSSPPAFMSALNNASATTEHLINGAARAASGSYRRRSFPPKLEESRPNSLAVNAGTSDPRGRGLLSLRRNRPVSPLVNGPRLDRDDSPYASHRTSLPTPGLPAKASSTGAAYMQRRKQLQQLYDTSDSERPSMSGVQRSRAFSRLSGDYAPEALAKLQQSLYTSDTDTRQKSVLTDISPSSSLRYPLSSVTAPEALSSAPRSLTPSTPLPRGGRRIHSAYHSVEPMSTGDFASKSELRSTFGCACGSDRLPQSGLAADKGANTKWRKLGSWIKKLGGH